MQPNFQKINQLLNTKLDEVDQLLRERQQNMKVLQSKPGVDHHVAPLTDVDLEMDQLWRDFLTTEFPEYGILSEEADDATLKEYTWIVDPIDGTGNYIHGLPYCVLLSLWHKQTPVYGMISVPDQNLRVYGGTDFGVFKNGQQLEKLQQSTAKPYITLGSGSPAEVKADIHLKIAKSVGSARDLGSCGYQSALLLIGQIDMVVIYDAAAWDEGPLLAMAKEVGLDVAWLGDQPTEASMLGQGYDQRVAVGRPDLVKKLVDIV